MLKPIRILALLGLMLSFGIAVHAQSLQTETMERETPEAQGVMTSSTSAARLVRFSGTMRERSGGPLTGTIGVSIAIYKEQQGGTPLWMETQNVLLDAQGNYSVLLGATQSEGLPLDLFATGESRWLGVQAQVPGEIEQPRVLLVSVPYALKAADADTLGGKPLSAFVLAVTDATGTQAASTVESGQRIVSQIAAAVSGAAVSSPVTTNGGTLNKLSKWDASGTNLVDSGVIESGGFVGIGTTGPVTPLTVTGGESGAILLVNNTTNGVRIGAAGGTGIIEGVDNTGFASYQPLIMGGAQFIFRISGTEKMRLDASGNLGIGTATPGQKLEVAGTAKVNTLMFADSTTQTSASAGLNSTNTYSAPQTVNESSGTVAITGNQTSGSGITIGVQGQTASTTSNASGVFGYATGGTGTTFGVEGRSDSTSGKGVQGFASAATGLTNGVFGESDSTNGTGVVGFAGAASGGTFGGSFQSSSTNGTGVFGTATATSGTTFGGYFQSASVLGRAVFGLASAATGGTDGVYGEADSTGGAGVFGTATSATGNTYGVLGNNVSTTAGAVGVQGNALATTGATFGVQGITNSATDFAAGVYGDAAATSGFTRGVIGVTASSSGTTFPNPMGVLGSASATSGVTYGVFGSTESATDNAAGVRGETHATTGQTIGVFGFTNSATDFTNGVHGQAQATSGQTRGVAGVVNSITDGAVGVLGTATGTTGNTDGVMGKVLSTSDGATGVLGQASGTTGQVYGVVGKTASASGAGGLFNNTASGNILLGQAAGTTVFRVDGTGKGFFNGGTQNSGADFAESVSPLGRKDRYEPGDVLMISMEKARTVERASEAYSTRVAGIYSTKPGVLATPYGIDDPTTQKNIPLAVIGIVPCKVSAANGPIRRGDLLVASSTPGYAMKGTDRSRMLGAVVGKALESLVEGTGVIEVLVTLQ